MVSGDLLIITHRPPHGSRYAAELLDLALAAAAMELNVSMLFLDDGVLQLLSGQNPKDCGIKNFANAFRAWQDYEIRHLFVDAQAMITRGLNPSQFIVPVEPLSTREISRLLHTAQVIING